MIKKLSLVFALVALLLTPLAVDLISAPPYTWDCYDISYGCSGTKSCSGDVMENPSRCKFRCKTGATYTAYLYCRYPVVIDPLVPQVQHPDIQVPY